MKKVYRDIWQLARPYYEKGRPMDIDHIEWIMDAASLLCEKENLDNSILLPLAILHDVGYAEVPKANPYKLNIREAHMKVGAVIAKRILEEVGYPAEKVEKISQFVSVHDSWAFGDNNIYNNDVLLGSFNDLDYMWMATPKGFPALMTILNKGKKELIDYLENNDKLKLRPFSTGTAKELYLKYIQDRKKEIV